MKKIYTVIIALSLCSGTIAQTGAIKGTVFDEKGVPFFLANVYIKGTKQGCTTDENGNFVIKPLPPGYYNLSLSFVGYKTIEVPNVYVRSDEDSFIADLFMESTVNEIDEIVIRPDNTSRNIDPGSVGKITMKDTELAKTAGGKDIVNIIKTMIPGTVVTGDQISFRGARTEANSYYIDGIKMSGLSSGIPGGAYGSVMVYTSGIPAKYGDVTGGVIIIETKSYFDYYNRSLSGE